MVNGLHCQSSFMRDINAKYGYYGINARINLGNYSKMRLHLRFKHSFFASQFRERPINRSVFKATTIYLLSRTCSTAEFVHCKPSGFQERVRRTEHLRPPVDGRRGRREHGVFPEGERDSRCEGSRHGMRIYKLSDNTIERLEKRLGTHRYYHEDGVYSI